MGNPFPAKTLNFCGERASGKEGPLARIKGRKELAAYLGMDDGGSQAAQDKAGLMVSKGKAAGRLWAEPAQLWDKAAGGRWGQPCQRPAGQFSAVTMSPPQVEKPTVDIQSLLGA